MDKDFEMFREWLAKVDAATVRIAGTPLDDLADQPFDEWYDRGISPEKAAKRTLRAEGWRG